MTRGRVLGALTAAVVLVIGLAASSHASAGEFHEAADCIACSLCEWLTHLVH